jgi:ParB family transcriptional regulator, chromosome partitioning protein
MNDGETPAAARKRTGLGRGLSALMGDMPIDTPVSVTGAEALPQGVRLVDTVGLRPMPDQPRKTFDDTALGELADSIRERGMLQPIVVRPAPGDSGWEIVAGERRWRAAQRAGLHQVPVIVRDFDDRTAFELAIVENIQREQLNAYEEGVAYQKLIATYDYTPDMVAKTVGKSRSHVANLIRLSNLPQRVHGWLAAGSLTMGHARALLTSDDPEGLGHQVMTRGLSVRQTEALVKRAKAPKRVRVSRETDPDIALLERQLADLTGLKTDIRHSQKSGTITLHYATLEQLDMICQRLSGERI